MAPRSYNCTEELDLDVIVNTSVFIPAFKATGIRLSYLQLCETNLPTRRVRKN
jgi:hypothetical protein